MFEAAEIGARVSKRDYLAALPQLRMDLINAQFDLKDADFPVLILLAGDDRVGCNEVLNVLHEWMDARFLQTSAFGRMSGEERRLPRAGEVVIFDRSWYGGVRVERVEGLAPEAAWRRAYGEINDFEENLVERGFVLQKFWLQIDREEQLRRFPEREKTPYKKYKITGDDCRNRSRWDDYASAVEDMVAHTSTDVAPWQLIPANDKRFAGIAVMRAVCAALGRRLS